jgi:hypothetical protein
MEMPFLSKDGSRRRLRLLNIDCCCCSIGCASSTRHARTITNESVHFCFVRCLNSLLFVKKDKKKNKKKKKRKTHIRNLSTIDERLIENRFAYCRFACLCESIMSHRYTATCNLLLFTFIFLIYLLVGAQIFSTIERPAEQILIDELSKTRQDFLEKYSCVKGWSIVNDDERMSY